MRGAWLTGLWLVVLPGAVASQGPESDPDTWTREKCALYRAIVADALALQGTGGLGQPFLDANNTFLAKGCSGERRLCPTTRQEHAFADLLTLMTMNEGMASTFVPFGCPD